MGDLPSWRWFVPVEGKYINAIIAKLSNEFLGNASYSFFDDDEFDDDFETKKDK